MAQEIINRQASWFIDLRRVTADKTASRSTIQVVDGMNRRTASSLVGVDGSIESGLRPATGFDLVADFDLGTDHSVVDFRPIYFDIDTNNSGYGFILLIRTDTGTHKLVAYWRVYGLTTWNTTEIAPNVNPAANWSVATSRRLIFVFTRGSDPTLFYVNEDPDNPGTFLAVVLASVGPGGTLSIEKSTSDAGLGTLGSYTFPATARAKLYLTTTAPESQTIYPSNPQLNIDTFKLEQGGYKFAFQLYDSRTGRWSMLSEELVFELADFSAADKYGVFEITYDSQRWDTVYIYRSLKREDSSSPYVASYLHLDLATTLSTYATTSQPGSPADARRAVIYYSLKDQALAGQRPWLDSRTFEQIVPSGGAAYMYETTLLVSDIAGSGDVISGRGDIRWSSLVDVAPELFPVESRFARPNPSDAITRFIEVAGNVIGFATANIVLLRRESFSIRALPVHTGYALVHPRAATPIASSVYFCTSRGLKVLSGNADLDDIRQTNYKIVEEWRNTQASIRMAYDALEATLYIYNIATSETLILWINTGKLTELHDLPFVAVEEGHFLDDPTVATSRVVPRALWLQAAGQFARIYVTDYKRTKLPNVRLLDHTGAGRTSISNISGSNFTLVDALGSNVVGVTFYNLHPDRLGNKTRITAYNDGTKVATVATATGFVTNDPISVSPVYCRFVSSPLGYTAEDGITMSSDVIRQRKLDTMSCSFTNVTLTGAAFPESATFRGFVVDGDSDTRLGSGVPRAPSGAAVRAVVDGVSPYSVAFLDVTQNTTNFPIRGGITGAAVAVGVEFFCTDLNFTLLGLQVSGYVLGTNIKVLP